MLADKILFIILYHPRKIIAHCYEMTALHFESKNWNP